MASDSEVLVTSQACDVAEREFVRLLISLYRDNPHLWDNKNPHYLHKMKRIRTLNEICDTLKAYKPNYTVENLKKKINILRTNFNKERHKIGAKRSADSTQDGVVIEPECSLWYYNDLLFLAEPGKEAPTRPVLTFSPQILSQNSSLKKKRAIESSPVPSTKCQENEAELMTKCWAMKLQRLAPHQRIFAEKIINDTLFEAAMGTLTRNGVRFLPETPPFIECSNTSNNEESRSPMFKLSPLSE